MSYPWYNKSQLKTLKVSGEKDMLFFEAEAEKCEVYLKENDIQKVTCITKGEKTIIERDQRYQLIVGEGNFKREVDHYLKPGGPAPFLRLGITKHCGLGTWSSLPHPFELNKDIGFEEVFFYLLDQGSKQALQVGQGVWWDGSPVNEVWRIKDRGWCTIPLGFHPVVGEPGVHVSYVWAYLAKKKEWEKIGPFPA